jgi:predicted ATPase
MDPDLLSRLQDFSKGVCRAAAYRAVVRADLESKASEMSVQKYKADLFARGGEVVKTWLDDSLRSNIDSISALGTSGLRKVIHDQELTFRILQEMRNNRVSMKFVLSEGTGDELVEGDPKRSFGGGALLFLSFVLRLAVMQKLRMGNLLILDESLYGLANRYVPAAADFMRQVSDQTGINILMVTHNDLFMDGAHTSYEAWKDGHTRLRRRQVR